MYDDENYEAEEYLDRHDEVQKLRSWALDTKIPLAHIDSLLDILRKRLLPELPKSAKTFLDTNNVECNIRELNGINNRDGGELAYFGIAVYLQKIINIRLHEECVLDLLFNIDGLLLYKSSSKQFWPILGKVPFEPDIYEPFLIAVYAGKLIQIIIYSEVLNLVCTIKIRLKKKRFLKNKEIKVKETYFLCYRYYVFVIFI